MSGDDEQASLRQFERDGRRSGGPSTDAADRAANTAVDRGSDAPFVLELKRSARDRSAAVDAVASDRGRLIEFDSRADAERFASRLSETGGVRVALQAVAPQDETSADAYLVPRPVRHRETPIDPDATTWRFQPGANQYGAIGEALLARPRTNPPALTYYARRDLGLDEDDLTVRVREPAVVTARSADGARMRWLPDLVAEAVRDSTGAHLRTYRCEIKTGDASFERDQVAVMEAAAEEPGTAALKIRVVIEELPDEYGVRITEVTP